jgi:hypothetical protein
LKYKLTKTVVRKVLPFGVGFRWGFIKVKNKEQGTKSWEYGI